MELDNEPIRLKKNQFWGKRAGAYSPKEGYFFKISRGGAARSGNNGPVGKKNRSYYFALRSFAAQARSVGWFNGKRLKKKGV